MSPNMNLFLGFVFVMLAGLADVYGQQGDKSTSIIPFPRIGRADRFFMADKRSQGNSNLPGLIPFPRIGRSDGNGIHEGKRQLIPFPRVGKRQRSYPWHFPIDPFFYEYEDFVQYPMPLLDPSNSILAPSTVTGDSTSTIGGDESDLEKRNGNGNNAPGGGNGMWFGPRLGKRRKRSIESDSVSARDSVDTKILLKILHNFNWAIVPIKERRTSFTPRLGRSSEEVGIHHRSPSYLPRLGRSREVSSVELEEESQSQNRYSRGGSGSSHSTQSPSDDSTTTVAQAPFSPRLGRDHFSPRLGRSSTEEIHEK